MALTAAPLLAALVILPATVRADSAMAASRLPLSARQQAGGGTYAAYDVLGVVENPAVLITQPRPFAVNAADQYYFGSRQNVLGLGAGWRTGAIETGAWGLALVAGQVSTAGFNEVDELGQTTGDRIKPVSRRVNAACAYQRYSIAVGAAVGWETESYGDLTDGAGHGPGGGEVSGGVLIPFDGGNAGAALQFPGLGTRAGSAIPDVLNAGATVAAAGLQFSASVVAPLTRPAAPSALAGLRCPVTDSFDLMAGVKAAFAREVPTALGTSARLGFSLRSRGLGMDYTIVLPFFSGMGVTNLIALGLDVGERQTGETAAPEPPLPVDR